MRNYNNVTKPNNQDEISSEYEGDILNLKMNLKSDVEVKPFEYQ